MIPNSIPTFAHREYKLIIAINKTRKIKKISGGNQAVNYLELRLLVRLRTNMSNFKKWEDDYSKNKKECLIGKC